MNSAARPLEFHCTAPVKANRAQEILYGPTLGPYLYGEQIGQTLLGRGRTQPVLAVTDVEDVLAARSYTTLPLVFVRPDMGHPRPSGGDDGAGASGRESAASSPGATGRKDCGSLFEFRLGTQRVAVSGAHEDDQQTVTAHWRSGLDGMDLHEPFDRIREAIQEALTKE